MTLDHVVHVLADFITRPAKERKRGDLAQAHIDVADALRGLVDCAAARAAERVATRDTARKVEQLNALLDARRLEIDRLQHQLEQWREAFALPDETNEAAVRRILGELMQQRWVPYQCPDEGCEEHT